MSLVSLLSIARSALLTHQRAMTVTGNNVANAQTPGYSRQRLELSEAYPLWSPQGSIGGGVDAATISRARDRFYDASFRRESGALGHASTQADLLSQVESALDEPSNQGLGAALDGLFSAFTDLVNDPASGTGRALVHQAASRLIDQLHQTDARLSQLTQDARDRMTDQVSQANALTRQIAQLNNDILAAGPNGSPALQDQRDLLLDHLSGLMSIQVVTHDDGSMAIQSGGALIVDGAQSHDLVVRATGTGPAVGLASGSGVVDLGPGSLQSLVELANTILPGARAALDQLTGNMAVQVNLIHRTGFTLSGASGVNFFNPAGIQAATIQLSSQILASNDAIAAGATTGTGDGRIAQRLGDLVRAPIAGLGNRSMRDFFVNIAGGVGLAVSDAQQQVTIQQTLVDNSDAQRQQVSGVSVDEEMVQLISEQQAYGAAAKLVSAADQMMQTVLQMLG